MNNEQKKDEGSWNYLLALIIIMIAGLAVTGLKIMGVF